MEEVGRDGVLERKLTSGSCNSHLFHSALTVEVECDAGSNISPKCQIAKDSKHSKE